MHCVWLFFLLRYLEVRAHGGDYRDVCSFGPRPALAPAPADTPGYQARGEGREEDEDVKMERQRVDGIVSGGKTRDQADVRRWRGGGS